jgi:hypothetical protein
MNKIKLTILGGVLFSIAFFTLLLIRLDYFQEKPISTPYLQTSLSTKSQDSWMNIYQANQKIGFIHRTLTNAGEKVHFNEKVFMQINTMGVVQDVYILTEGDLNPDMTLSSFRFNLNSGIFRFNARGYVTNNKLVLLIGSPGFMQKQEIPLKKIPHISGNLYDAAFRANIAKEVPQKFDIFDPSSMSVREIKITRKADEIIKIMGKKILTKKYCVDFMGAESCAWLDSDGNVVRESGILGLSMERVGQEEALKGITGSSDIDFTEIVSIPSNLKIKDADKITQIRYRISCNGDHLFLNGGRQSLQNDILTITKEVIDDSIPIINDSAEAGHFLISEPFIQSDDPQIKKQLEKIIQKNDTPAQKARKIIVWVFKNIQKKPTLSLPNALEVLKNKSGDCNEHSVLTVALLRAAGIPAQIESGLVYLEGRFYYHAWCVLYLNDWITADAVFNQFPADVTHIRLVRGGSSEQLNLMGMMGKLKLEVLETKK